VLLRRFDEDTADGVEPDQPAFPRGRGVTMAIRKDEGELAAIFVAKLGRIEREQRSKSTRVAPGAGS
jgi:hypothetical protein